MTDSASSPSSRNIPRSIGAVVAGAVAGILLSIGSDLALQKAGIFPPLSQPQLFTSSLLLLATIHRTVWGVLGSYLTARLAPNKPMMHAWILGFLGLAANVIGTIMGWNLGHHWYPLTLIALALPTTWVGGKLRLMQLS